MKDQLIVKGARQHNLKNIDISYMYLFTFW